MSKRGSEQSKGCKLPLFIVITLFLCHILSWATLCCVFVDYVRFDLVIVNALSIKDDCITNVLDLYKC